MPIKNDVLDFQYFNLPARYFTSLDMNTIRSDLKLIAKINTEHLIVAVSELKEGLTIQIIAEKDEPGIFLRVAAVLYSHGISILKATIFTGEKDTMVIDHFVVHPQTERALLNLACSEIRIALTEKTTCVPVLRPADNTGLTVACTPSQAGYAIVKMEAKEQAGFLYRVANVFSDLDLSLVDADIKTLQDQIVDTFHIVTSGRRMPTPEKLAELHAALLSAFAK